MADDSQGFDWSALLQSATPFAAALIPAALGAIAGGRGGAATGAATGFASGMRGQVEEQQQYEKQRAQVEEANQRARIQQEEQALRTQEFRIHQQNIERQNQIAAMQIPHLEAQTKEINQKMEHYRLSEENAVKWANENLKGAEREAFLLMTPAEKSQRAERWEKEEKQARALPGLLAQARSFGMPLDVGKSIAAGPKGFDRLSDFVDKNILERTKPHEARQIYSEVSGNFTDANGKPLVARFNRITGMTEFAPLPPGVKPEGKALTSTQEEALINKRLQALIPVNRTRDPEAYEAKRSELMAGPYGDAVVNIQDQKEYEKAIGKLKEADVKGTANAKKVYEKSPEMIPGGFLRKAKPLPFEEYIETPDGKTFLESHKEKARAQGTTAAPAPAPGKAPGGGKALDEATARKIYEEAGRDPAKAEALAKQRGYRIE